MPLSYDLAYISLRILNLPFIKNSLFNKVALQALPELQKPVRFCPAVGVYRPRSPGPGCRLISKEILSLT